MGCWRQGGDELTGLGVAALDGRARRARGESCGLLATRALVPPACSDVLQRFAGDVPAALGESLYTTSPLKPIGIGWMCCCGAVTVVGELGGAGPRGLE